MSSRALTWAWDQSPRTAAQKLVLAALADRADEDGVCYPSLRWIAAKCAPMSVSSAKKAIAELVDAGLLVKEERKRREDGGYSVWIYRLPVPDPTDRPRSLPQTADGPTEPSRTKKTSSSANAEAPLLSPAALVRACIEDEVGRIYSYWREQRGRTRANYDTMSPARAAKIRSRLTEFSLPELLLAIDGVGYDPWPDRRLHDDITIIFRSRESTDKFIRLEETRPRSGGGLTPAEILDLTKGDRP